MEREVQLLEASALPDVIIADKGAIAAREGSKYNFFIAKDDDLKKATAPGLVTLVSYVARHLYRNDPVVQLVRDGGSYESLRGIRRDAHDLFLKVMEPKLVSDDKNNPPLELGELPSEPGDERPPLNALLDDTFEEKEPSRDGLEADTSPEIREDLPEEQA